MNNKMNTSLTTNFIFIFSIFTYCCIQATHITVVDNVNKKGFDNPLCLFGILPCLTLDYVFSHLSDCYYFQISISLLEGNYTFTLDSTITGGLFKNCPVINITGVGFVNTSIVCGIDAGFAFQNISQVKIANINFTNCGALRNLISVNSPNTTLSTALYFTYCMNVTIVNVIVQNSNSTGVVMYNTYGNLLVEGSSFNHNSDQKNSLPSKGGFHIEFTYCDPGKVGENCVHQKKSHTNYHFKSNKFISNVAFNETEGTLFYVPYKTTYYSFGRGGGLSIVFKGNACDNTIIIDNCTFNENLASQDGGGLFVNFVDSSKRNSMIINNTDFTDNLVIATNGYGTTGGGVSVGYVIFDQKSVEYNSVLFENCLFARNTALWGGGFGTYISSEPNVTFATNSLSFKNCSWIANEGLLGSAVDLYYWPIHNGGVKMQVKFSACKFHGNDKKDPQYMYILENLQEINSFGAGALYANGIPIIFEKYVEFICNNGSALAIYDATATFSDNCNASFINNFAWEGGAVALLGASQMWINPHTVFLFKNNTAELRGGAIYALQTSRHDILTGGNCFLHYTNISVSSPNKWETNFTFKNNHAPTGSSIFTTTLLSCAWGESLEDINSVLNVLNSTHFWYDLSDNNTIATEVSKIKIETNTSKPFEIIPGKYSKLPITTLDDKSNNINRSLWLVSSNKSVQVAWGITDSSFIILKGMPKSEASLEMVTDNSHAVSAKLLVKLVECPPGYYFDSDKHQTCRCSYLNCMQILDGILPCDSDTFTAKIKRGYWAGYHLSPENPTPTDTNLVTGQCPRHYCKVKNQSQVISLPDTSNKTLLNEFFCSPGNRNGTLCGICANGYGVAINSAYFDCINCSRWTHWVSRHHGWIIYALTEYVPLTVFVFFVLRFDINPHSGISSLIVLYFQVFGLLNIYSDEDVNPPTRSRYVLSGINFLYNVWNLEFFGSFLPPYCISKNFNAMDILWIKYISGIYPFILLLLFTVLKKGCCRKWCKFESKNGLAALYTLVFTKFAVLSGLILSWKTLSGSEHSKVKVTVAWLNGDLPYGGTKHLIYMIPAVPSLIFVLITAIGLLCCPLVPQRISQCNNKLCSPFKKLCTCHRHGSLFEIFQKDYHKKYKFYAGLLFIYRIFIVLVFSFTIGADSIFYITIASLVLIVITAICHPYKKSLDNAVAILCIFIIILINLLSFNNLHYTEIQSYCNRDLQFWLWLQLALVLCPLGIYIFYIIIKVRSLWKRRTCWNRYSVIPQTDNDESNNRARDNDHHSSPCLQNTTGSIQSLEDPTEDSSIIPSTHSVPDCGSFESHNASHNKL